MGAEFLTMEYEGILSKSEVEKLVIKKIRAGQESLRMSGESYTGTWGEAEAYCDVHDRIFESFDEAEGWLLNTAQKWEGAVAVRYRTAKKVPKDSSLLYKADLEKVLKDSKKLLSLQSKKDKIEASFIKVSASLRDAKIQLNELASKSTKEHCKCQSCGSSIAKQFVKIYDELGKVSVKERRDNGYDYLLTSSIPLCPLCKAPFAEKKTASLKDKVDKLNALGEEYYQCIAEEKKEVSSIEEKTQAKYKAVDSLVWLAAALVSS